MATTTQKFATALLSGATETEITSTDIGERKIVWSLTLLNSHSSAVLVYLGIFNNSGTDVLDNTTYIGVRVIQPNKIWSPLAEMGSLVLGPQETLAVSANVADKIIINCGGTAED